MSEKEKEKLASTNLIRVPVLFTPRECMKYDEVITLDINNLHKIDIRILGEGIPFKLELENTEDQQVGLFNLQFK